jgi:hypothetical protein
MPKKKKDRVKKPKDAQGLYIIMRRADIEAAMAAYEEEMNKTPEGKKMLKEDKEMAEKVMKEGK